MLAKVLLYAAPSLREIAKEAGITEAAMREYVKARRTAPPAVIRRLVAVLRARGGKLRTLAAQLERQAGGR
ncbi:MAG TPA: hypothetical protein VKQ05_12965 [Gemmatimonadales bacterium]|nr:hypothetical protein [Gemmatimonadales bacterium]